MAVGGFSQSGGTHVVDGTLTIQGYFERDFAPMSAHYVLSGGILTSRSTSISLGDLTQSAGTNHVGELVITDPYYTSTAYDLNGGLLTASNVTASAYFRQSGGVHVVSRSLNLRSPSRFVSRPYTFSDGELIVRDIQLSSGGLFRHVGGSLSHSGFLTLADGHWECASGAQQFGVLIL